MNFVSGQKVLTKQSIQHISCSSDNEFKQVTQLILSYLGKTLNSRQIFHLNCKIFMFDPIKRMLNMQEANSELSAVHCYSATYCEAQARVRQGWARDGP